MNSLAMVCDGCGLGTQADVALVRGGDLPDPLQPGAALPAPPRRFAVHRREDIVERFIPELAVTPYEAGLDAAAQVAHRQADLRLIPLLGMILLDQGAAMRVVAMFEDVGAKFAQDRE